MIQEHGASGVQVLALSTACQLHMLVSAQGLNNIPSSDRDPRIEAEPFDLATGS